MAALAIAAIGVAVAGASAISQNSAQKEMSEATMQAENARHRQQELQAASERRKAFRDAQAKSAVSRANASAAGADAEGSSGAAGGLAQISTNLGQRIGELNSSEGIGNDIFNANAKYSEAKGDFAEAGAWGQMGKDIFASAEKLGAIGTQVGTFAGAGPSKLVMFQGAQNG